MLGPMDPKKDQELFPMSSRGKEENRGEPSVAEGRRLDIRLGSR